MAATAHGGHWAHGSNWDPRAGPSGFNDAFAAECRSGTWVWGVAPQFGSESLGVPLNPLISIDIH